MDQRRQREKMANTFARQALPMVWDFAEANPFGGSSGDVRKYLKETADLIETLAVGQPALLRPGIRDKSSARR